MRFPEFEGEWEKVKLGDIADITKLAGFEFTQFVIYEDEGSIIALRGLNCKNGQLDLSNVKYIDHSVLSKLSRSKLFIGDILFTYVGTVGEVAIINENDRFYLAPNVARIRLSQDNPNFVKQILYNKSFYNKIISPLIATSSQPALSMSNVRRFDLYLPIQEEQGKIAIFFQLIDQRIYTQNKIIESLESLIKGLYVQYFSKMESILKLDSVCTIQKGEQINGDELSELGEYYVMNGGILPSGYYHKFNTLGDTISISEGGNSCGYVQYNNKPFWSGGHCYSLLNIKIGRAHV